MGRYDDDLHSDREMNLESTIVLLLFLFYFSCKVGGAVGRSGSGAPPLCSNHVSAGRLDQLRRVLLCSAPQASRVTS